MRITPKHCFLVLPLLLSGCDNNFATLTFGQPVISDPYGHGSPSAERILPAYRDPLLELFHTQGVKPGTISMSTPTNNSIVLSEPWFGGLDKKQRAGLQDAIQAIIDSRSNPLEATFSIKNRTSSHIRTKSATSQHDVGLTVKGVVISISYGAREILGSALNNSAQMQSEAFCNVSMGVEPELPFNALHLQQRKDEPSVYLLSKSSFPPSNRKSVTTDISVNPPELQTLIDSRQVVFSTNLTNKASSFGNHSGIKQLDLLLGPLGPVSHEQAEISYEAQTKLEAQCRDMAAKLGRPFTFSLGHSLDRLQSVRF